MRLRSANPLDLGLGQVTLGGREVGPRLLGRGGEKLRVDAGDELPLGYLGIEVDQDLAQRTGHLASDLDGHER